MPDQKIYDIIGIGVGPFNLGLAALCHPIPNLHCLFLEQKSNFEWHPGMMIPDARLQVPFYADLVTLANPCSPFSYMTYLHAKQKLFRFAIAENYFVTRKSYQDYCSWVAAQLPSLKFNQTCESIEYNDDIYEVRTKTDQFRAKQLVLGIGTVPYLPPFVQELNHELITHSANYLNHKSALVAKPAITLVGSGQSAAEIFYDLMQCYSGKLSWFTRSSRIFPMDYSKFALEMASPSYIDHFYSLDSAAKKRTLAGQDNLYKGINESLITAIYHALDEKEDTTDIQLRPNCELNGVAIHNDLSLQLKFHHQELNQSFEHRSSTLILATGYKHKQPNFIEPIHDYIQFSSDGNFQVNRDYAIDSHSRIFVQNAEMHTHGFNAADLSLGPYRNAIILNKILGYEYYRIETKTTFQQFGMD